MGYRIAPTNIRCARDSKDGVLRADYSAIRVRLSQPGGIVTRYLLDHQGAGSANVGRVAPDRFAVCRIEVGGLAAHLSEVLEMT